MKIFTLIISVFVFGCGANENAEPIAIEFEGSQKVTLKGYTDHIMEPFLSRDGSTLIFNNSNDPSVNTNLHWATKIDDVTFEYKGEVSGTNTTSLEGVPTLDKNGVLYFVSTRSYFQTQASIYQSSFLNGVASTPGIVLGLSKNEVGWLNFDVEVDASGENLYFVDGRFDQNGGPYEADIVIARKNSNGFERLSNSKEILKNINTASLEYAACISTNSLELYFTRLETPVTASSLSEIFVASRKSQDDVFGIPSMIESISGLVEGPTISQDGNLLYYHKMDNGKFSLFLTRRIK